MYFVTRKVSVQSEYILCNYKGIGKKQLLREIIIGNKPLLPETFLVTKHIFTLYLERSWDETGLYLERYWGEAAFS